MEEQQLIYLMEFVFESYLPYINFLSTKHARMLLKIFKKPHSNMDCGSIFSH